MLDRSLSARTALFLLAAAAPAVAQLEGELDDRFWSDGRVAVSQLATGDFTVGSVAVGPDDLVVAAGTRAEVGFAADRFYLLRASEAAYELCDFDPPGDSGSLTGGSIAFDNAGRLLLAGSVQHGGSRRVAIAAFEYPECTLDPNFDGDGYATFDPVVGAEHVYDLALDSHGRILVAGAAQPATGQDFLVLRVLPSGAPDTTFSGDGWTTIDVLGVELDDRVSAVVPIPSGSPAVPDAVYLVGTTAIGTAGDADMAVVRLTGTGTPDPTFSGDGIAFVPFDLGSTPGNRNDSAYAAARDPVTGRLYAVGSAGTDSGPRVAVAALTPAGALDGAFSGDGRATFLNGTSAAYAAQLDSLRRLVVLGRSGAADYEFLVARVAANGALDTSFGFLGALAVPFDLGSGNTDIGRAVTFHGGLPVLAGEVQLADDTEKPGLARLWSTLVFADGFDRGSTAGWSSVFNPPPGP